MKPYSRFQKKVGNNKIAGTSKATKTVIAQSKTQTGAEPAHPKGKLNLNVTSSKTAQISRFNESFNRISPIMIKNNIGRIKFGSPRLINQTAGIGPIDESEKGAQKLISPVGKKKWNASEKQIGSTLNLISQFLDDGELGKN